MPKRSRIALIKQNFKSIRHKTILQQEFGRKHLEREIWSFELFFVFLHKIKDIITWSFNHATIKSTKRGCATKLTYSLWHTLYNFPIVLPIVLAKLENIL